MIGSDAMGDLPLAGKIAIVTGAGRGLGRSMALGLAHAGAGVVATASRERAEVEQVAAEAKAAGGVILPIVADVTRDEDCRRVVDAACTQLGGLHILVNNAGRGMKYVSETFLTEATHFWDVSPEVWRMVIDTNVNGPFLMARAAVPHLRSQGWGRIVNVSMNHATMRRAGFSPYGPSKAALESETIIWSQDLAGSGSLSTRYCPARRRSPGWSPMPFPRPRGRNCCTRTS
jgi:3-oxoacyl-[acyl-carrier protein] reductase